MAIKHRRRLAAALGTVSVVIAASLVSAAPAQATAVGCDPLPRPPVTVHCGEVNGGGTWVNWVQVNTALSGSTCDTQAAARFYDSSGSNYHNIWGPYGCNWGASFRWHLDRHMRTGKACLIFNRNGSQLAGVCHRIKA